MQSRLARVVARAIYIRHNAPYASDIDNVPLRVNEQGVEEANHSHGPEDVDGKHFRDFVNVGIDGCHGVANPSAEQYVSIGHVLAKDYRIYSRVIYQDVKAVVGNAGHFDSKLFDICILGDIGGEGVDPAFRQVLTRLMR